MVVTSVAGKRGAMACVGIAFCLVAPGYLDASPVASTGSPVPGQPKRVLVVNSYHDGYPWTDDIVKGIRAALAKSAGNLDVDLEYLDWRRHPDPEHSIEFARYLRRKLGERPPEVIIATDDPAVHLLMDNRNTLFPDTPVIFCGVNEFRGSSAYVSAHPEERPWMAGVLETLDPEGTIDLALRLHPRTREVVLVGEASDTHGYVDSISASHPGLTVRNIPAQKISLAQTGQELEKLKPGSIVLFNAFTRDGTGQSFTIAETSRFVARHTHVPIYTGNVPTLGYGAIGGRMADPYAQGQTAALMALAALAGTPPSLIGIQRSGILAYEFEYNQLLRWHIPLADLPPGSVILNKPKPFYQEHPRFVFALGLLAAGQFVGIVILLAQRRLRQAAETALRAHSQQLAQSNYMLEQFAYITAHDFQEPIRTVALFSELLSRSAHRLGDDEQRSIEFVLEHSRRLHSMVRGLLAWVRSVDVPAGSRPSCDANQLVLQAIEPYQAVIAQEGIEISVSNLPPLNMHADHFREVMRQLLQNAIEHSGRRPLNISIGAQSLKNGWTVCVHNSGDPIPKNLQSRIFGVFRRADDSRGGIGMGLAICRRIVDSYGGRIWVESDPGKGCTFCFTVPDVPSPRARRPQWLHLRPITYSRHAHSNR